MPKALPTCGAPTRWRRETLSKRRSRPSPSTRSPMKRSRRPGRRSGTKGRPGRKRELAAASAGSLPPEQRLLIEAGLHQAEKDWPKAVDSYRRLFAEFPDNLDYGLRLAEAQIFGGRAKEALVTLEGLRKLPAPAAQDPRIDLAEARAQKALGNNQASRDAAAKGAAAGAARGMRILEARARARESAGAPRPRAAGPRDGGGREGAGPGRGRGRPGLDGASPRADGQDGRAEGRPRRGGTTLRSRAQDLRHHRRREQRRPRARRKGPSLAEARTTSGILGPLRPGPGHLSTDRRQVRGGRHPERPRGQAPDRGRLSPARRRGTRRRFPSSARWATRRGSPRP